jgi:hypothetical protein
MCKLLPTIAAASAAAKEELSVFFAKLRTSGIFGKRERERRPTGGETSSHPPAHKGWMTSGHDSSFLLGFVPNLTMVVTSVAFFPTYLPTYQQPASWLLVGC